jgi:hypothetical protein
MRRSATLEGFRLIFRHPSFGLAEIAWRWSFGAAAVLLGTYTLGAYFDSLTVQPSDMFLLRTRQPAFIAQAMAHIFSGSGGRLIDGVIILFVALSLAWILIASLGRAATLRALLGQLPDAPPISGGGFGTLLGLNFLRAAVLLATLVGTIAALGLGGLATSKDPLAIGAASELSMAVLALVWGAGYLLNWFLSLASIFSGIATPDSENRRSSTASAIGSAFDFCQERFVGVLTTNTWFGFSHLAAAAFAGTLILIPLSLAALLPEKLIFACAIVIALIYCAVADFLCVGKLAAYLYLRTMPEPPPPVPVPLPITPATSIDKAELILSDLPMLPESGA